MWIYKIVTSRGWLKGQVRTQVGGKLVFYLLTEGRSSHVPFVVCILAISFICVLGHLRGMLILYLSYVIV